MIIVIGEIFVAQVSIFGGGSDRRILLLDWSPVFIPTRVVSVFMSVAFFCW